MRRSYRLRQARPRTALLLVDGPTCPGGDQSAALRRIGGETLVARAARQAEDRGVMRVIAITGCQASEVVEAFFEGESVRATRLTFPNPDWKHGGCVRALSHAARRWVEPVLLIDGSYGWSDDDLDRVCAGQYPLSIGIFHPCQRVGVAMFRRRAAAWFADRAAGDALLGSRGRPWQDLLRGSRGGLAMGSVALDGVSSSADPIAMGSW